MGHMNYDKLFKLLEKKGKNKKYLRDNGVHPRGVYKLLRGESVSTDTICQICHILHCQPKDIMEYVEVDSEQD